MAKNSNMAHSVAEEIHNALVFIESKAVLVGGFLATLFAPVVPFLASVYLFLIADTIMGYLKARHNVKRKRANNEVIAKEEETNSKNFKSGLVPKLLAYGTVVVILYVADLYIFNEAVKQYTGFSFVITKVFAGALIWIELWSIDENFKAIFGVSIIQVIKTGVTKGKSFVTKALSK